MKIKFESDDDLPLDKILNIPVCVLITGGFFKEDSKYYSQILLNECYYDLINLFFYNDLINVKDFDARLLKLDKKTSMGLNIYYIGYVTKKPEWNVNSVNLLYLMINKIDGFVEEKMEINT